MALSYTICPEGSTYSNSKHFKVYEDALAETKRLSDRKPQQTYVLYQSVLTVGSPKLPVEITPTYFDYSVNARQVTPIPAGGKLERNDEDEDF